MTRVLVTGSSGQLSICLAEAGPRTGIEVITAGRPSLDLTAPRSVTEAIARHRPDAIVNAAAYTAVDKAEAEPDAAFSVNGLGAGVVATAAESAGVPLIHISTDYVFDGSKSSPYCEEDEVAPASVYGRSKLEGERRVAAATPRHVILRTAWVHSPFGSNFVRTMLRLAASRTDITVVDDQTGSPTYAPHLAVAILAVVRKIGRLESGAPPIWGCYHAAGSGSTSWCGLARAVFSVSGRLGGPTAAIRPIATRDYPTAATRPANSRLDSTRLATVLGVALPDWRLGVEDCVTRLVTGALPDSSRTSGKDHSA